MFRLQTATFPKTAIDLARLLNESVQRVFITAADPVTVREKSYPELDAVSVRLDGARLRENPPRPPLAIGEVSQALRVAHIDIRGTRLAVGPANLDLALTAQEVRLTQSKDRDNQIVLQLDSASDGKIVISTARTDLEALIAEVAKREAAKNGVAIDAVELTVRPRSSHSVAADVQLRARKLFMSASIRITAQLNLDEQLNARISGLNCAGDGALGTLACSVLAPHLQKINGREFALMSLPLGEVRLRDVRISAGEKLSVTAEFGSETAA